MNFSVDTLGNIKHNEMNNKAKTLLILAGFILFSAMTISLFSLFTSPQFIPGFSLAFLAGISMIFLPCTFPLVFVIVPLALSRHIGKVTIMAVLFVPWAYSDFLSLWIGFELARRFCPIV